MKEFEELKDITPEQRKQVSKLLSKARSGLLWITVKYFAGLFGANFIAIAIAGTLLKDIDPDALSWFKVISMFTNLIFLTLYLDRRIKTNSAMVVTGIKEILKK